VTARNHALGGLEATLAIARVTLQRTVRGKALWIVLGLCLLPELYGAIARGFSPVRRWDATIGLWSLLLSVIPPVMLAGTIGEEIEERTAAYLWSRPLPRWTIVVGKLVALVPILVVMMCASLALPFYTTLDSEMTGQPALLGHALLAVSLATIVASLVTAGLATLAPRFGTVLAIGYFMLIDNGLGAMLAKVRLLSISRDARLLAGPYGDPDLGTIPWLVGIGVVWMAVALWRIRRIE